ncbi:OLC1v1005477C1 [Oldenlandia corymbosa var. corymbosa]|uniref:OLC1v1005477C1 n=1 Tax=Oldenlandia corymbosa var. corymbosa TaxID=529605 RepID=A0AAV1DI51_OLDCO|nr:OLC1v1005477C1 [Oldenlandia corymbosa var. corymbosa]
MAETEAVKSNPRPIIRIGLFFMSHSLLVSVVCYVAGIFALLLLPILSKNTYISENALMPGSASPMLSNDDVSEANRFMNQISNLDSSFSRLRIEVPRLIAHHISAMGGEVNHHKFGPQLKKQHPLRFFTIHDPGTIQDNFTCSSLGTNTIGIIRAPRGDGKEAILLVTPYNSSKITTGEVLALGIGYSIFSLLSRVTWLAKDIIWLASDSRHGEYRAVTAWLREYHTPLFGGLGKLQDELCLEPSSFSEGKPLETIDARNLDTFRRAGTMAAALVVKVADTSSELEKDALSIYAEASNGQMPNLDLINIVNYLAVYGQGLRVRVEKMYSFLHSHWLKGLGGVFESLGKLAKSLNPEWNFDISIAEYIEGSATLASSLYNQALGVPTGSHGAFRDYQIDAITMEISHQMSSNYRNRQNELLTRSGRLIEGVIRSINNLLEKFHQSFFLYLLTSPNKFVSVGVYMIPFALLVAPLPVVAAALFSAASRISSEGQVATSTSVKNPSNKFRSWRWLAAAKTVFIVHFWGALMTLLPYLSGQIPEFTPATGVWLWIVLPVISLLLFTFPRRKGSQSSTAEWMYLKSVTIAAAFIGLSLMSVINFATAEIGAILLVPMCLMAAPLSIKIQSLRTIVQGACNLIFAFLGFPPLTFFVLKGAIQDLESTSIGEFWTWMVSLWEWSSATYVFICMVHLPCWALCAVTLLQRS